MFANNGDKSTLMFIWLSTEYYCIGIKQKPLSQRFLFLMYAQHGRYLYGESPERGLASAYRSWKQGCLSWGRIRRKL